MASNTDIYNMSEALFDLQKNIMEETDEETLVLGTYGFFNAAISKMIVDNIIINACIIAVFAYVSVYSEKLFIFTRHAPVVVIKCLLF